MLFLILLIASQPTQIVETSLKKGSEKGRMAFYFSLCVVAL